MPKFAVVHDSVITRIVESARSPFHASLNVVEVTGTAAQVGNTVDAMGNVGPSVAYSGAAADDRKRTMAEGEVDFRMVKGVWLPEDDAEGHLFDTAPESLGLLATLSAVGSDYVPAADGALVKIAAPDVFHAAGLYMAACLARAAALHDELQSNPDAKVDEGWPENGEPSEVAPAAKPVATPLPVSATPDRGVGTGIIPEQTVESPHAEPPVNVEGMVEAPLVVPPAVAV